MKEKEIPEISEEEIIFQKKVKAIHAALNTPEGRKLGCKIKVFNDQGSAVIYQGMLSNAFGRIYKNARNDYIYRSILERFLREHPETAPHFK